MEAAVAALGLDEWVASLPEGLDTRLGAGGVTLSAGEEQLVAFARLLVRDVAVVVLDEATARMDPQTEERVTRAASALLAGRTGILVAHRLSTVRRADTVAVLDGGRVVQQGPRARARAAARAVRGSARRGRRDRRPRASGPAPLRRAVRRPVAPPEPARAPRLWRAVRRRCSPRTRAGACSAGSCSRLATVGGATGAVTGWLWGEVVGALQSGGRPWGSALLLAGVLLLFPVWIAFAFRTYPLWWSAIALRMRLAVLRGQTMQHRLARTPPGEVVARALDSDRLVLYADRWVDVANGADRGGGDRARVRRRPRRGGDRCRARAVRGDLRGGRAARGTGRAGGRPTRAPGSVTALGSALEAVRTVKLAAAVGPVRAHLADVDRHRVRAAIREQSVRAVLDGVPGIVVQSAVVLTWSLHLTGTWDLADRAAGHDGAVRLGVPGAGVRRRRHRGADRAAVAGRGRAAGRLVAADRAAARGGPGRRRGAGPGRAAARAAAAAVAGEDDRGARRRHGRRRGRRPRRRRRRAGAADRPGRVRASRACSRGWPAWSGTRARCAGTAARSTTRSRSCGPARSPTSRSCRACCPARSPTTSRSGTGARSATPSPTPACGPDVDAAGGTAAVVGHRGIRLSGGQVQRLAMARALATGAELIVADDVSSALDVRTEIELWSALRRRGTTVVGASSKRAALARADRVVVLEDGRVADQGAVAGAGRALGAPGRLSAVIGRIRSGPDRRALLGERGGALAGVVRGEHGGVDLGLAGPALVVRPVVGRRRDPLGRGDGQRPVRGDRLRELDGGVARVAVVDEAVDQADVRGAGRRRSARR